MTKKLITSDSQFIEDRAEGVQGLLEHVEILGTQIQEIRGPEMATIITAEGAEKALHEINKLRSQIQSYQRTAQTLRIALERTLH